MKRKGGDVCRVNFNKLLVYLFKNVQIVPKFSEKSFITARVIFILGNVCLFTTGGGRDPIPGLDGGGGGTQGTPPPWLDGVPPSTMTGWGTPHHDWMGYSPNHDWMGYPPTSIASTCCVAGGMPLALTQENFLVIFKFKPLNSIRSRQSEELVLLIDYGNEDFVYFKKVSFNQISKECPDS